ncbi:hypothetical protein CLOM_g2157 [Closterium sp. NIES-68]|nr:hypothetical protein CLOM_g2157 [Closterium sp. NIES-68]GJP68773.1 hypothetical protein CLOP_g25434 [Closterium sp. NIES-67]
MDDLCAQSRATIRDKYRLGTRTTLSAVTPAAFPGKSSPAASPAASPVVPWRERVADVAETDMRWAVATYAAAPVEAPQEDTRYRTSGGVATYTAAPKRSSTPTPSARNCGGRITNLAQGASRVTPAISGGTKEEWKETGGSRSRPPVGSARAKGKSIGSLAELRQLAMTQQGQQMTQQGQQMTQHGQQMSQRQKLRQKQRNEQPKRGRSGPLRAAVSPSTRAYRARNRSLGDDVTFRGIALDSDADTDVSTSQNWGAINREASPKSTAWRRVDSGSLMRRESAARATEARAWIDDAERAGEADKGRAERARWKEDAERTGGEAEGGGESESSAETGRSALEMPQSAKPFVPSAPALHQCFSPAPATPGRFAASLKSLVGRLQFVASKGGRDRDDWRSGGGERDRGGIRSGEGRGAESAPGAIGEGVNAAPAVRAARTPALTSPTQVVTSPSQGLTSPTPAVHRGGTLKGGSKTRVSGAAAGAAAGATAGGAAAGPAAGAIAATSKQKASLPCVNKSATLITVTPRMKLPSSATFSGGNAPPVPAPQHMQHVPRSRSGAGAGTGAGAGAGAGTGAGAGAGSGAAEVHDPRRPTKEESTGRGHGDHHNRLDDLYPQSYHPKVIVQAPESGLAVAAAASVPAVAAAAAGAAAAGPEAVEKWLQSADLTAWPLETEVEWEESAWEGGSMWEGSAWGESGVLPSVHTPCHTLFKFQEDISIAEAAALWGYNGTHSMEPVSCAPITGYSSVPQWYPSGPAFVQQMEVDQQHFLNGPWSHDMTPCSTLLPSYSKCHQQPNSAHLCDLPANGEWQCELWFAPSAQAVRYP